LPSGWPSPKTPTGDTLSDEKVTGSAEKSMTFCIATPDIHAYMETATVVYQASSSGSTEPAVGKGGTPSPCKLSLYDDFREINIY
jgi:hypothetical protein